MGITRDTMFSTFVAIGIFILGYIANRIYENWKKRQELEEIRKYFYILVKLLSEPIDKQIKGFLEFCDVLKKPPGGRYAFTAVASFSLETLKQVQHFDLYQIFLKGKSKVNHAKTLEFENKVKSFQKIHDSIHVLESIEGQYLNTYSDFIEGKKIYEKLWVESATALQTFLLEQSGILTAKKSNTDEEPFFHELTQHTISFQEREDKDAIHIMVEHYIRPAQDICEKHIVDERAVLFLTRLIACMDAYDAIVRMHHTTRTQFLLYARRTQTAKIDLEKGLNELKA